MVKALPINPYKVKEDFPIFEQEKTLVYLDSTATSQKPRQVIEAVERFYMSQNANVHRGVYGLSVEATEEYEKARRKVAEFINARSPREIVFVRNTTEALNLVAYSLGLNKLAPKSKIVLTMMEHHSNIVPWQLVARLKAHKLDYIPFTSDGYLDLSKIEETLDGAGVFSFVHASNVLGTINDAKIGRAHV